MFPLSLMAFLFGFIVLCALDSIHDAPYDLACQDYNKGHTTLTWIWDNPDTSYCIKTESTYTPYSELNK